MVQPALASDGKDSLPVVQRVPVNVLTIAHLSHEEHLILLLPLLRGQRRGELGAVHAHQTSHAELDEVAMQEEGLEVVEIGRVGLEHRHAAAGGQVVAFVVVLRLEAMRDLGVVEGERTEGGGECIFVAPARAALGDESVEVFGAVVIVVGTEAQGLSGGLASSDHRGMCPYLPMAFLIPHHLTRIHGRDVGSRRAFLHALADNVGQPRRFGAFPVIGPQHDTGVSIRGRVEYGVGRFDGYTVAVEKQHLLKRGEVHGSDFVLVWMDESGHLAQVITHVPTADPFLGQLVAPSFFLLDGIFQPDLDRQTAAQKTQHAQRRGCIFRVPPARHHDDTTALIHIVRILW